MAKNFTLKLPAAFDQLEINIHQVDLGIIEIRQTDVKYYDGKWHLHIILSKDDKQHLHLIKPNERPGA